MSTIKEIQSYRITPRQVMISIHKDIYYKLITSLKTLKWMELPKGFKPVFGLNTRIELIDPNMKYKVTAAPEESETNNYEFSVEPWNKEELFKHIDEQRIIGDNVPKDSMYKPYIIMYEKLNKNTAIIGILEHNIYRRYKIKDIRNLFKDDYSIPQKDLSKYVEEIYDYPVQNKWIKEYLQHGKCILNKGKDKIRII